MSPYMYRGLIEVYEGYGMDVDLPTKVDFIIYEPNERAKALRQLAPEDSYVLKLIKER